MKRSWLVVVVLILVCTVVSEELAKPKALPWIASND